MGESATAALRDPNPRHLPLRFSSDVVPSGALQRRWRDGTVLFGVLLFLGALLRIRIALAAPGEMNSDQAVVYLMARQMSEGELSTYYWGQRYGGTLTPLFLALVFLVVGPQYWLLPVVVVLIGLVLVLMVRSVASRAYGAGAGNLAGGLLCLGPPGFITMTVTNEAGFYGLGMLLCVAALRAAMALRASPTARPAALLGLLSGLACWTSPFSFLGLVPAAVVAVPILLRRLDLLLPGAGGFAPGGLLLLAAFLREPLPVDTLGTASQRLTGMVTAVWPATFTVFTELPFEPLPATRLLGIAFFVLCAVVVLVRLARKADRFATGLWLQLALWPVFMTATGGLSDAPSWRYGVTLLPSLALVMAPLGRRTSVGCTVLAAWAAVFVGGVLSSTGGLPPRPCPLFSLPNQELTRVLTAEDRRALWGDYWLAYRLSAETDERLTVDPVIYSRDIGYARAAEAAPRTTVVVFTGLSNDLEMRAFTAARTDVRVLKVQHYSVYAFEGKVPRSELPPMISTPEAPEPSVPAGACD